jgi:hypothetical protein
MPAGWKLKFVKIQLILVSSKPALKGNFIQINWLFLDSISKPACRPLIYE